MPDTVSNNAGDTEWEREHWRESLAGSNRGRESLGTQLLRFDRDFGVSEHQGLGFVCDHQAGFPTIHLSALMKSQGKQHNILFVPSIECPGL